MDLELAGKVVAHHGRHRRTRPRPGRAAGGGGRVRGRVRPRRGAAARRRSGRARAGGDVLAQRADVTPAADLAGVRRRRRRPLGPHRRGGAQRRARLGRPLESVDDATWESDFELKLMAAVRLTRLALPQLRASRGSVLFTLAMAAKAPGAASEPSSVTRAAGMALMKALSKELAPDGIRVNAVLIGLIESGQWVRTAAASGDRAGGLLRALRQDAGIPLGRFGRAEEFADLGCFLLSSGPRTSPERRSTSTAACPRRLRLSCSPRSRWRRPSRRLEPDGEAVDLSMRVSASTCARPSPPHFALAARRAEAMSSATTNTTSWSSPMRPGRARPPGTRRRGARGAA